MAGRRLLVAIVLLAAALHAIGVARSILPAQDGLKFIRIARQFQTRPWIDVVRDADQHPLYPALVALAEPTVALVAGRGPDTWRIAAQTVSSMAALALLFPLFGLARALFDERIATLAVLIYVLLPLPGEVGHDTLSDSLAMLGFVTGLRLGELALTSPGWLMPAACGLVSGLGYLARPEVLVAPAAVFLVSATRWRLDSIPSRAVGRLSAVAVSFLAIVGSYALIKGEVSGKLALRQGVGLVARPHPIRRGGHTLPPGLNSPRWDFSPKEESEGRSTTAPEWVLRRLVLQWAEGLAGIFAFFAAWGFVRDSSIRRLIERDARGTACVERWPGGRQLIATYLVLFAAVLARHAMRMGYVSGRHTLTLVLVSVPWAAAGIWFCSRRLAMTLDWSDRLARRVGVSVLAVAICLGIAYQVRPGHPSRWGHWAAGRWLRTHAAPGDAVLDTRGWAAFVSGRPSYDYWHVRQSFTDSRLAYIVVGTDELEASGRRAATLRAVLAYAATPCVEFPERPGGREVGVRVYRFHRPDSWKELTP